MNKFVLLLSIIFQAPAFSQEQPKVKTVYEKRQKIDLGAISIEGEVVSPGDFSVSDEEAEMTMKLYKRKTYNDRFKVNIDYVF